MADYKRQHTLGKWHMRLFACTDCPVPCRKFVWQNDRISRISRRVPLDSLEKQDWIHDAGTEQWITRLEGMMLNVYRQIRDKVDPITIPTIIRDGQPVLPDFRIPIWNYVASILTRRTAKSDFDNVVARLLSPERIEAHAFQICLKTPGITWEAAKAQAEARRLADIEKHQIEWRGLLERKVLDGNDCPFGELCLLQTSGHLVLPDIGFCQRGRMVFMPVTPNNTFVAVIGVLHADFSWPRSDFPVVLPGRLRIEEDDTIVDADQINRWSEEQPGSRMLYSEKPFYDVVKDCCPRSDRPSVEVE